jgi:hypothetical protein
LEGRSFAVDYKLIASLGYGCVPGSRGSTSQEITRLCEYQLKRISPRCVNLDDSG